MNSAITSANNATLASVASNYALRTVTDQMALDLAAKQSGLDVDTKIANALLDRPSTGDLTAAVNLKTTRRRSKGDHGTANLCDPSRFGRGPGLARRQARRGRGVHSSLASGTTGLNSLLAVRDGKLKFEMISCCHHVLGVFKYSPKCFVVRSALRCFRELPSSLLKF